MSFPIKSLRAKKSNIILRCTPLKPKNLFPALAWKFAGRMDFVAHNYQVVAVKFAPLNLPQPRL